MNAKLLAARAFMPQSMLRDDDDESSEDEGELSNSQLSSRAPSVAGSSKPQLSDTFGSSSQLVGRRPSRAAAADERSNSVSKRHGDKSSRSSGTRNGVDKFASVLVEKKATVLTINIVGLHGALPGKDNAWIEKSLASWLGEIQAAAKAEKGVVDSFHGDRVVVTFNSSNNVSAHVRKAAQCALAIAAAAKAKSQFPVLSMGLSSGRVLVGNIGTQTLRAFTTLGTCYTHAASLERVARKMSVRDNETTILATVNCSDEIGFTAYHYPVGKLQQPPLDAILIASFLDKANDDEWLYELDTANQNNPFVAISSVMTHLINGHRAEAVTAYHLSESKFSSPDAQTTLGIAASRGWAMVNRIVNDSSEEWKLTCV